jgi:hypothetical protein
MNSEKWQQQQPPWIAFPKLKADQLPCNQGAEEVWIDEVWRPFWHALSSEQKTQYLDHWQASKGWWDAIAFAFEDKPDFDAKEDFAESQRMLAALSEEAKRKSWIGKVAAWFGR